MENGNETESVDIMHFIWNNEWPSNRTPKLKDFRLNEKLADDNIYLEAGQKYMASVEIEDPEGDSIEYIWDVKNESTDLGDGGDFESTPESISNLLSGAGSEVELTAPSKSGPYRLFIYANDGHGHTAHANIPFYVN